MLTKLLHLARTCYYAKREHKTIAALAALVLFLLWNTSIYPRLKDAICLPVEIVPQASAEELPEATSLAFGTKKPKAPAKLTFASSLGTPDIQLPIPAKGYWQLPEGPDYKNATLRACQDALRTKGVTDSTAQRYGCAILLHENGAMTPERIHGGGVAFGLCGQNVGNVAAFWKRHPEAKTVAYQINWCTKRFADAYARFSGSIFRSVVQHHCPACARANVDSCKDHGRRLNKCYFQRVKDTANRLALLP